MGGKGELFWQTATEPQEAPGRSVSFDLAADQWQTYEIPFHCVSPLKGLRLDPGAAAGVSEIESIRLVYGATDVVDSSDLDPTRLASWTLVARALLNLDETITRP